ncbi:MAG: PEP-CTERM sorting domain-containing protein [Chthoniobacteraceae bacterium]
MKKSVFLSIVASLATLPLASATTVGWGATPSSRSVVQPNSSAVTAGSEVLIGTFANENFSLSSGTVLANWTSIMAAGGCSQFASPIFTSSIAGGTKVGGQTTDNTGTATAFNGKTIYLVLFDTTSPNTATEMGIFKATSASPAWVFPNNNNGIGDTQTSLGTDITAAATIVAVGTTPIGSANSTQLQLAAPVPEPSTLTFGALAALAAAGSRRRNRR